KLNEAASAKPSNSKPARKKKAARSSSKRKSASANVTPIGKAEAGKPHVAGPGGRKLLTREDAELEPPAAEPLLPDAPLRKVARRRKSDGLEGTGT
ncbi:MAG TPA: hypothetical protein VK034_15965, partial [Enhygromyxa sp.]|nr:hypothetical protein [Enhygromyxa sp.]